jgi:hypothetical protein
MCVAVRSSNVDAARARSAHREAFSSRTSRNFQRAAKLPLARGARMLDAPRRSWHIGCCTSPPALRDRYGNEVFPMNNSIVIIGTLALAIGTSYVVAQTAPPPANAPATQAPTHTQTPTPVPTPNPAPTTAPMAPRTNMPATGPQAMAPNTLPPDFTTLDHTGIGYVTQQQASGNPWLSTHFASCDADHNGQVSRAEFATCSKSP